MKGYDIPTFIPQAAVASPPAPRRVRAGIEVPKQPTVKVDATRLEIESESGRSRTVTPSSTCDELIEGLTCHGRFEANVVDTLYNLRCATCNAKWRLVRIL